jgi:hypothetical protein
LYDNKCSDEEELEKKRNKRRKEKTTRSTKKGQQPMSGLVLPVAGDKTVAAEAFGKLNPKQPKRNMPMKGNNSCVHQTSFIVQCI